ncbi:hypothetical protein PAL_GLEAN10016194 [Pteropus alecto]|uniref:Uncharacterized protein n=1 Tax=Pteropus alecto TaxID=9402 RepID=L5KST9_PTEAL|nr:hypothetical protein PAL_GLEAN10016194 [Pteropus alecto]
MDGGCAKPQPNRPVSGTGSTPFKGVGGEQREVSYHQTSWVRTTAMGPEADKGLGHVTWATASERNCSRTECTGRSVQGANPEPQAFRDSRVAFPIESPA